MAVTSFYILSVLLALSFFSIESVEALKCLLCESKETLDDACIIKDPSQDQIFEDKFGNRECTGCKDCICQSEQFDRRTLQCINRTCAEKTAEIKQGDCKDAVRIGRKRHYCYCDFDNCHPGSRNPNSGTKKPDTTTITDSAPSSRTIVVCWNAASLAIFHVMCGNMFA